MNQKKLKSLLRYEPETGLFYWLVARQRVKAGAQAGYLNKKGYTRIKVDGKLYRAHRLAYLYMTGFWPEPEVDHKDGDKSNNRWRNLRPATSSQNKYNTPARNKLGVKGVYPSGEKFQVLLRENGKAGYFGTFDTIEQAEIVSLEHQKRLHGEFQCS